jgi:hypothetical protein
MRLLSVKRAFLTNFGSKRRQTAQDACNNRKRTVQLASEVEKGGRSNRRSCDSNVLAKAPSEVSGL